MEQAHPRPLRPHYAWVVCAACAIMLFIAMGMAANVFSVYQPYILAANGFTNAQGSLIVTIRCLLALVGMMTAEFLFSRLGLRRTAALGLGLQILSRVIFAFSHSFPAYCAGAVLSGLCYAWAGMVPLSLLMGRWFQDRRGFAVGLSSTGSGVATVLLPPVISSLVEQFGLTFTFLTEAGFTLALSILVVLLVRNTPEEMGLSPYRTNAESVVPPAEASVGGLSNARWGAVLFGIFLLAGTVGPGFNHLTMLYTTEGYAPTLVSWLWSYMGLALIVGKIGYGQIADRLGGWRSNFLIGGVILGAQAACCMAPLGSIFFPILSTTLFGFGLPIGSVSFAIWAQDLRGKNNYQAAVQQCNIAYAIGNFMFGPLPGILADYMGSYVPAYIVFMLLSLVCLVILQWTYRSLGLNQR